jgi:hypothetical protein
MKVEDRKRIVCQMGRVSISQPAKNKGRSVEGREE